MSKIHINFYFCCALSRPNSYIKVTLYLTFLKVCVCNLLFICIDLLTLIYWFILYLLIYLLLLLFNYSFCYYLILLSLLKFLFYRKLILKFLWSKMVVKFSCKICNHAVAKNHHAVQCDHCQLWVHIKYNKINLQTYKFLQKSSFALYCIKCFGDIILFWTVSDHELSQTNKS